MSVFSRLGSRLDSYLGLGATSPVGPVRPEGYQGGWSNALTGMGFAQTDPSQSTHYAPPRAITEAEATALFRSGLSRRIVQLPSGEALRKGYDVLQDSQPVDALVAWASTLPTHREGALGLDPALVRWLELWRIYGGSAIVLVTGDGPDTSLPLNEASPRLQEIRVLSRYEIEPPWGRGEVWYASRTGTRWHRSRVIPLGRSLLPDTQTSLTNGWDDSVYTVIWRELMACGTVDAAALRAVEQYSIPWQKVSGLVQQLSRGGSAILERMGLEQLMASMYRVRVLDTSEDMGITTQSVSGLAELMDRFHGHVAMVTGIPRTLLTGSDAGGMSTADKTGERFFYDRVAAQEQRQILLPALRRLYALAAADRGLPAPEIKFRPLYQLTELEEEDLRMKRAQRDEVYIANGVLTPAEVREARFAASAGDVKLSRGSAAPQPEGVS